MASLEDVNAVMNPLAMVVSGMAALIFAGTGEWVLFMAFAALFASNLASTVVSRAKTQDKTPNVSSPK